jgi:hypothetical protein
MLANEAGRLTRALSLLRLLLLTVAVLATVLSFAAALAGLGEPQQPFTSVQPDREPKSANVVVLVGPAPASARAAAGEWQMASP